MIDYDTIQRISGIYIISNKLNNKIYVGSAIDCRRRAYQHKSKLIKNTHENIYLQRAWNKYGEENFELKVIITVLNKADLIYFEQKIMDENKGNLYNLSDKAMPNLGKKQSPESILKIKKARAKQIIPKESYQKAHETRLKNNPNYYSEMGKKGGEILRIKLLTNPRTDFSSCQTKEHREKISKIVIDRCNKSGQPFICNETNQTFRSCGECARQMNLKSYKCIWKCLTGKLKSYCGFTFTYLTIR